MAKVTIFEPLIFSFFCPKEKEVTTRATSNNAILFDIF
jgi:hypothetical protein